MVNKQCRGFFYGLYRHRHHFLTAHGRKVLHTFLGMVLLFSPLTYAQEDLASPETIAGEEALLFQEIPSVYGASKYEQKVSEAPSAVTIITADEIRKYGYRTLAEVLQSVTGFYVTNDRNYSYLGVRGFNRPGDYNSRILLLLDGHRLNDNIYEAATIWTASLVDVDFIDRIEIIRGPSSSLYGTNAFFGVINVITKRGRDVKGVELSTEYGSYESYKGRFTYGDKFQNGLEVLLSGSFSDSDGHDRLFFKEFDSPETNNGVTRNGDDDRAISVFGKLSYKDFTFMGGFQNREKGIPTASFGTSFNTRRTRTVDERAYADMRYIHDFANQLNLNARVYYDRFYYRGDYLYDDV